MAKSTVSRDDSNETWRFIYPRWWVPGVIILAVFCLAHLLLFLYVFCLLRSLNAGLSPHEVLFVDIGKTELTPFDSSRLIIGLLPGQIASFTVLVFSLIILKRTTLRAANACVRIADTGLEYTNHLGQVQVFCWDDIEQVSLVRAGGFTRSPEFFLHHAGGQVRFPSFLERTQELAAAVAARVGLTPMPRTWYQQRFIR